MEHKEEQSSENIDNIDNIDNTEMPFVTALTTPFPQPTASPHAETLQKTKERERAIQRYKRQIQELDFAIGRYSRILQTKHGSQCPDSTHRLC